MSKVLQNKIVVSSLSAVALLGIAANLIDWRRHGAYGVPALAGMRSAESRPSPIHQASDQPNAAPAKAGTPYAETFEIPARLAMSDQFSAWAKLTPPVQRDPFAWPDSLAQTNATIVRPAPSFVLQAISIDADKAFAVLNQRVVSPGESLGEYVVERILPREVWMVGPAGRIVITLAQ